jgi:hypothetical protein
MLFGSNISDIYVSDSLDQNYDSIFNFGNTYELPIGLSYFSDENYKYLAGA